ncbi:MAG TPA: phenylalanine--tRNA ligase subunit beta [Planctomycetota bacterium]|nr:phenylalanine--tRNA ligase subunit beta [Planctomycetota bacterium]
MKLSCEWLREYVKFKLSPQELAERLTAAGLPCEGLEQVGDDWVLSIEVPSNRPDCLGILGLAREVATVCREALVVPEAAPEKGRASAGSMVRVSVEDQELCPRYVARVITGVRVGPSPEWMQRRLAALGVRPINNVVDVTNYVLLETGQPLHAFDYEKVAGHAVTVRRARPKEKIALLGGVAKELDGADLVIADETGPVALAGIMGGERSEVGPGTANVLLESAVFLSTAVRRTCRRLALSTESSYRFERSTDWNGAEYASRRAAALIASLAGGSVASGAVDTGRETPKARQITVRYWRVDNLLGAHMEKHTIRRILLDLGLESVYESGEGVTFLVPSFRPDLSREVDLVEEVARHFGYERLPAATRIPVAIPARSPADEASREVRRRLAALAFCETVTTSILPREQGLAIRPWRSAREFQLTNPPRAGQDFLRQSLLPSLLEVRRVNQAARVRDVSVFDLGRAYLCRPDGSVDERRLLAALDDHAAAAADGPFGRLRLGLDAVLGAFGAGALLRVEPGDLPYMEPGESARLFLGDEFLGVMGRLSEKLRGLYDLRTRPAMWEINLDMLIARGRPMSGLIPLPKYPAVRRDVALVLDESASWSTVAAAVAAVPCPLRESIEFMSVYRGQPLEAGKKSLAFSVTYRSAERTLTDEEVNALHAELVKALTGKLGATLRA